MGEAVALYYLIHYLNIRHIKLTHGLNIAQLELQWRGFTTTRNIEKLLNCIRYSIIIDSS